MSESTLQDLIDAKENLDEAIRHLQGGANQDRKTRHLKFIDPKFATALTSLLDLQAGLAARIKRAETIGR